MPSGGTAISAGVSLLSGRKASKEASRSRGLQREQLQLMAERDEFNKEIIEEMNKFARQERKDRLARRERARGIYDPVEESLVEQAMEDPAARAREAEGRAVADVRQQFGVQRGRMRREAQRYGVQPGAGRWQAEGRRLASSEALAGVYAGSKARRAEEDRSWAERIAVAGMGNMKDTTVSTSLGQLGVPGAAGVYGDMAQTAAQSASGAFGLMGKTAADAMEYWDQSGGWGAGSTSSGGGGANWMDPYGEDSVN